MKFVNEKINKFNEYGYYIARNLLKSETLNLKNQINNYISRLAKSNNVNIHSKNINDKVKEAYKIKIPGLNEKLGNKLYDAFNRHLLVREYLINSCGIKPNNIGLVYHGVDNLITQNQHKPFNFPSISEFIFTVGSIRPARGLDDVFNALSNLSKNGHDTPHVVIAGETTKGTAAYKNYLN